MTVPAGRVDFFAREAGDYLGELDRLLGGAAQPPGEALVRLTRALRGAAMLAGPPTFTAAAKQLEQIAKLLRDGTLGWSDLAPHIRTAVAELQRLLGFARTWNPERDSEATALTRSLAAVVDSPARPAPPAPAPTGREGMRTYVAREAAAVAGALDQAAHALGAGAPDASEGITAVTIAMQSIRGVAGLAELEPLPDLLDAIDAAIGELVRYPSPPRRSGDLFAAMATALARVGRDVAESGHPGAGLPDVESVADLCFELFAGREGIVPIESLMAADGPSVRPYGDRSGPRPAEPLDLASLGERLRQGAAQLGAASSPLAAKLQAFVLLTVLREAPGGIGTRPAGPLIASLVAALDTGAAAADPARFAAVLDQAGLRLTEGGREDIHALDHELTRLAGEVHPPTAQEPDVVPIEVLLAAEEPVVPIEALLAAEETVVPIEALLLDEGSVVPIEDLLEEEPPVVPIEALLQEEEPIPIEWLAPSGWSSVAPADRTVLERSLSRYSQLVREEAAVAPFESLLPPAAAEPRPEPQVLVFAPAAWPAAAATPAIPVPPMHHDLADELDVVPIERLLYTGSAALGRADAVRRELETALRAATSELDRLDPLVRELLDLVPLSLAGDD